MLEEIRKLLGSVPFSPFSIRTADGHEYSVPTRDHILVPPGGSRVFVSDNKGQVAIIPALLINALLTTDPEQATA